VSVSARAASTLAACQACLYADLARLDRAVSMPLTVRPAAPPAVRRSGRGTLQHVAMYLWFTGRMGG
jgi:hypothetical protein